MNNFKSSDNLPDSLGKSKDTQIDYLWILIRSNIVLAPRRNFVISLLKSLFNIVTVKSWRVYLYYYINNFSVNNIKCCVLGLNFILNWEI